MLARTLFVGTVCLSICARAEPVGNPANGQTLARAVCGSCHEVERYWERADGIASPFTVIARSAHSPFSLRVFLRIPHAKMPNLVLTATEIEDFAAYIWSMRREQRSGPD